MFDDGILKIYKKIHEAADARRPRYRLEFYAEAWYGEINFTVQELYLHREFETRLGKRIRIHQARALSDNFVFDIDGIQYDVIRVWQGDARGIPITDLTLAAVVERYEVD